MQARRKGRVDRDSGQRGSISLTWRGGRCACNKDQQKRKKEKK
jgi:hypothetical protein